MVINRDDDRMTAGYGLTTARGPVAWLLPVTRSKMPRVLPVLLGAVLAAGLSACSGGDGSPVESSGSPAASVPVTPQGVASPGEAVTPDAVTPGGITTPGGTATPSQETPLGEGNVSGIREIDAEETGQLSLLGTGSIVVDTGRGVKEALLTADTVVLDTQGSVCAEGAIPHRCSSKQLAKALKAGVSFYAKVMISDGMAVRIEEIVKE